MALADSGSSRPRSVIRSVSAPRPATPPIPSSTPPSSSSRCAPNPASSGGHLPAKGTNSHTVCERGKPNRDVGKLVDAYRNIQLLSWPLILSHEFISAVFSWEYPILTIGIWITLQLFSFYMTTGQLLVVCFLMLFVVASLGYLSYTNQQLTEKHNSSQKQNFGIHLTTNSTSSSSLSSSSSSSFSTSPSASSHVPGTTSCSTNQKVTRGGDSQKAKVPVSSSPPKNTVSSTSVPSSLPKGDGCLATGHDRKKHAELEVDSHRRRELLTEYRQMMQDLSRWLTTVSSILLRVEELLLWRCRWKTILFYLALHTGVLCVMYLPFRWITMATTNCLLLAHPQCYVGFEKMKKWATSKIYSKDMSEDESSNHLNNSQDKEHGPHLQKDGVVSSHPLSEDVNANEDTDEEVQGERGKRGTQIMVPASIGLDGPATVHQPKKFESGMCYLCGTLFTSVLKRRRYCRGCGRDFCPKCCSKKLPRSLLGATAPAAQTEKELVCNLCIIKLTGEEVGGSRVR